MKTLRNLIIPLLLFSLLLTIACPARGAIQNAIDSTEKIDSVTSTAVETTKAAFNDGLITVEQKDMLLPKLNALAKGSEAFKNAANQLKVQYGSAIPLNKLKVLGSLLESSVVAPFLEVLSDLKLIKNSSKILAVIGLIHYSVVSILKAFEKNESVSLINQRFNEAHISPFG